MRKLTPDQEGLVTVALEWYPQGRLVLNGEGYTFQVHPTAKPQSLAELAEDRDYPTDDRLRAAGWEPLIGGVSWVKDGRAFIVRHPCRAKLTDITQASHTLRLSEAGWSRTPGGGWAKPVQGSSAVVHVLSPSSARADLATAVGLVLPLFNGTVPEVVRFALGFAALYDLQPLEVK